VVCPSAYGDTDIPCGADAALVMTKRICQVGVTGAGVALVVLSRSGLSLTSYISSSNSACRQSAGPDADTSLHIEGFISCPTAICMEIYLGDED
jgi:hypothetical protein